MKSSHLKIFSRKLNKGEVFGVAASGGGVARMTSKVVRKQNENFKDSVRTITKETVFLSFLEEIFRLFFHFTFTIFLWVFANFFHVFLDIFSFLFC